MIVSRDESRWINQRKKTLLCLPATTDEPRWKVGRDYALEHPELDAMSFTVAGQTLHVTKTSARMVLPSGVYEIPDALLEGSGDLTADDKAHDQEADRG